MKEKKLHMHRKLLFIVLMLMGLFVFNDSLLAQNSYVQGYIINYGNDTLNGMIRNQQDDETYRICYFKDNEVETSYSPADIKGYGTLFGLRYTSQVLEGSFVAVLEKGDISLYRHNDRFLLEKQGELIKIGEDAGKALAQDSWSGRSNDRYQWKRDLSNLIKDRLTDHTQILLDFTPNERSLVKLVTRYNGSSGDLYNLFLSNKRKVQIQFGVISGISRTAINSSGHHTSNQHMRKADFEADELSIGMVAAFNFPRLSKKFGLQGELQFQHTNYSDLVSIENYGGINEQYHDLFMQLSTLSMPLSITLKQPISQLYEITFQGGVNLDYHLYFDSKRFSEYVYDGVVKTSPEKEVLEEINHFQYGLWGGIAFARSFGKFSGALAIRYFKMPHFYDRDELKLSTNSFSIYVIVTKI